MSKCYYHPSKGVWQTTSEPSEAILAGYPEGTVEIPFPPGRDYEWNGRTWVLMTPDPAELLARERSLMRCRAASMRLVLHRMGLLQTVQAIADSDPEASIVWEYEPEFVRTSPFISALAAGMFTDAQIDDLFRAAMQI